MKEYVVTVAGKVVGFFLASDIHVAQLTASRKYGNKENVCVMTTQFAIATNRISAEAV